jgi:hypothetical protein
MDGNGWWERSPVMAGAAIGKPREPWSTRPPAMGLAVGFMGYHGMAWGSMGITRNAMEKLGFFRFFADAAKLNINESNSL